MSQQPHPNKRPQIGKLLRTRWAKAAIAVIGLIAVYLFRPRRERCSARCAVI